MMLGPGHPAWTKLYEALADLAARCAGSFAFVVDEGNGLWCVGLAGKDATTATRDEDRAADRFYRAEIAPRLASMHSGTSLDMAKTDGDDRYVALSFAGIYALVVWFEADTALEPSFVRARMKRALPAIEALTLSLPPSGGPGSDAGAAKIRA